MTDREERKARRVKKMAVKELPNQLDAERLDRALRDLPKEARDALIDIARGSQSNFDHINGEMKRATDYHNEHADEVNFLKDELDHEHPSHMPKTQVGFDVFDVIDDGHWVAPHNYGGGDINYAEYSVPTALPVFIDKPCTILQLRIENITSAPLDEAYFCIYAGDADGNFPGSLLLDVTGDTGLDLTATGFISSPEFELDVGPGWYWLVHVYDTTTPGIHTNSEITSFDNGWAHGPIDNGGHWPFPMLAWALDSGTDWAFNSLSLFSLDWPNLGAGPYIPPVAHFMDDWQQVQSLSTPFYSSYAPIIEYRVR